MEKYTRPAVFALLDKYCLLAKPDDFIEVCEWSNGVGVDVTISSQLGNVMVPFTWGQLRALKKLVKQL